jgi:Fe-S-cluster-containing dehydrogenase component
MDRIDVVSAITLLPNGNEFSPSTRQPSAGRRSFLSGVSRAVSQTIVRKATGTSTLIDHCRLPKQPRNAIPYIGGHEMRYLMQHLAAQAEQAPARAYLPQVVVSEHCRAHAACSRLCPTGALRHSVFDGAQSLSFDAWRCISCGACQKACPENALHYETPALRAFEQSPALLSHVVMSECERCNERFSPAHETGLCPQCRKSASLSHAGFSLFAHVRQTIPAETGPP